MAEKRKNTTSVMDIESVSSLVEEQHQREDKDDDSFVRNPPPTVITTTRVPSAVLQNDVHCHFQETTLASTGWEGQQQFSAKEARHHTPHNLDSNQDDFCWYLLQLLSGVVYVMASSLYFLSAMIRLSDTGDENVSNNGIETHYNYNVIAFQAKPDHESSSVNVYMILLCSAALFFLLAGILQFASFRRQHQKLQQRQDGSISVCKEVLEGGIVVIFASLSLVTSSVLVIKDAVSSGIFYAVSVQLFAINAIAAFEMHQKNNHRKQRHQHHRDDNDERHHYHRCHQQDSFCRCCCCCWCCCTSGATWRRIADAFLVMGTIADSVLSYFYILVISNPDDDAPTSEEQQLQLQKYAYASVAASSCWVLSTMIHLVVMVGNSKKLDKDSRDGVDSEPKPVSITVVEGGTNTVSTKTVEEESYFTCLSNMTPDLDQMCGSTYAREFMNELRSQSNEEEIFRNSSTSRDANTGNNSAIANHKHINNRNVGDDDNVTQIDIDKYLTHMASDLDQVCGSTFEWGESFKYGSKGQHQRQEQDFSRFDTNKFIIKK